MGFQRTEEFDRLNKRAQELREQLHAEGFTPKQSGDIGLLMLANEGIDFIVRRMGPLAKVLPPQIIATRFAEGLVASGLLLGAFEGVLLSRGNIGPAVEPEIVLASEGGAS